MALTSSAATGSQGEPARRAPGPVQRTVELLSLLAEAEGPVAIRDVTRLLGLPPSTTHRLLRQLVDAGFVTVEPVSRRYEVGPSLHRVAALVQAKSSAARTAQPFLDEVTRQCGETSLFAMFQHTAATIAFIAKADSPQTLSYRIELNVPISAYWGSSSQVITAYLPERDMRRVIEQAGASPVGDRPPLPESEYLDLLATIRRRGVVVTKGEKLPGAVGTAAPVFAATGIVGSLTVTIPEVRYRHDMQPALQRLVVETARRISQALGKRGPEDAEALPHG